jgi:hypothetical protein
MRRALTLRSLAKGAGTVVVAIVVLDLVATAITVALGVQLVKR